MLNVEHDFYNKSESRKNSFLVEKSYNKTVIDFKFGTHEDLSTLKSDIHFFVLLSCSSLNNAWLKMHDDVLFCWFNLRL